MIEQEWDYCQIGYQIRHKNSNVGYSVHKQVWLTFLAQAAGPQQSYLAGSAEIPMDAVIAGASLVPQKNIVGHVNIQQNLLRELRDDGWELLPEKGSAWWENRLRRPARPSKSIISWLKTAIAKARG